jgi:DegV family protein with EDD domain
MQIVTDSGVDFAPEQLKGIEISIIPLLVMMNGRTYRSGVDLQTDEFYNMLDASNVFPTTSQPSAGDFAELYRSLAAKDKDIISIHLSSNLSGTYNSARLGAEQVPEANITLVDSRTVSGALGWVVEAVAKAIKAGWTREEIMPLVKLVSDKTDIVYTIATLKYLVHGGRIGRVKGLVGSLMDFKPIIGIDKNEGINVPKGQVRTLKKGILHIAELVSHQYEPGTEMRFQVLSGNNKEGADMLKERLDQVFKCHFIETTSISPVLGAHTGSGLVGLTYGPWEPFAKLPWEKGN